MYEMNWNICIKWLFWFIKKKMLVLMFLNMLVNVCVEIWLNYLKK